MLKSKIVLMCLFTAVLFSSAAAEEKVYNFEKEVTAKSLKDYSANVKIDSKIENKDVLNSKELKIKLKEDKINVWKDLKIKDVKIEPINTSNGLTYNISLIESTPTVVVTKEKERDFSNYIIFGIGGYEKIDSFKYIIDYTKEDIEKELTYFLHLGRDIKGEYRFNNDTSLDNYFGKVWYKNLNISLSHVITDDKLPGNNTKTALIGWRKDKSTEVGLGYDLIKEPKQNLRLGGSFYSKGVTSSEKKTLKDFDNTYFNLYGSFDRIIPTTDVKLWNIGAIDNFFDIKGQYYSESLKSPYKMPITNNSVDEDTSIFKVEAKDRIKVKKDEKLDLNLRLGFEVVNGNAGNVNTSENNLVLESSINRAVRDDLTLGLKIGKTKERKLRRELISDFTYDNDLLMPREVDTEDVFRTELSAYVNQKDFLITSKLRYININKMVIYEEEDSQKQFVGQSPIRISNYDGNKGYFEGELGGSYSLNNYKFDVNYIYTTLGGVPYTSRHRVTSGIRYKDLKNDARFEILGFSQFYSKKDELNRHSGYSLLNFSYTYQFNSNLDLSAKINNILDKNYEYKNGYKAEPRKMMVELKINY